MDRRLIRAFSLSRKPHIVIPAQAGIQVGMAHVLLGQADFEKALPAYPGNRIPGLSSGLDFRVL